MKEGTEDAPGTENRVRILGAKESTCRLNVGKGFQFTDSSGIPRPIPWGKAREVKSRSAQMPGILHAAAIVEHIPQVQISAGSGFFYTSFGGGGKEKKGGKSIGLGLHPRLMAFMLDLVGCAALDSEKLEKRRRVVPLALYLISVGTFEKDLVQRQASPREVGHQSGDGLADRP